MRAEAWTFLSVAVLAVFFAGPSPGQQEKPVAFGVLAFGGAEDAHSRWGRTIEALSRAMPDRRFDLVPLTLDGASAALEARTLHFLLTNPGHFHSLMLKHELAPLVSLRTDAPGKVRTENRYGAVIVARNAPDGPRRLADLKGRTFGAVAPDAFGGWQLALHTLRRNGLEPDRDFAELRFFGFPQSAIVHAVLDGDIDAGTVRTGLLEAMTEAGEIPEGALVVLNPLNVPDFELALSTALIPEWLIAATPTAEPGLRRDVARTLLDIVQSPLADVPAWQPPQSIAPVVEIRRALNEADSNGDPFGPARPLLLAAATVTIASLAMVLSRRRRDPRIAASVPGDAGLALRAPSGDAPEVSLTPREGEILELVENGQTTKEIARILSISPKTVEFHRHNLMRKFDASNMADLVHRSGLWRQRT